MKTHFEPRRIQIAERVNFRRRRQSEGESIDQCNAALRKLAQHCNFGANLEHELRDQIVFGLLKESHQRRLLAVADLTYARTMELVQGYEAAEANTKAM